MLDSLAPLAPYGVTDNSPIKCIKSRSGRKKRTPWRPGHNTRFAGNRIVSVPAEELKPKHAANSLRSLSNRQLSFLHRHEFLVGIAQAHGQHLGELLDQGARQPLVLLAQHFELLALEDVELGILERRRIVEACLLYTSDAADE